ncbi:mannosyltransferase family protein [Scytonema hofmannii]|nr:mannosyltransferase family protein [Scytonema hofmannii]
MKLQNTFGKGLFFAITMWLASRLFIAVLMLLIAPLFPSPSGGIAATFSWDVFHAWDSEQYRIIATHGYTDSQNGEPALIVAFFPLFPLIVRAIMSVGMPFQIAGLLVNNLAFLGALIVLYTWINERHGVNAARWTTAVLAWCPLSLFGTVIYTEGLYLLLSTAALRAFDNQKYGWTALWGSLATATRPTGIALWISLLLVAVLDRRGIKAIIASLSTGSGLLLFSLYCQIKYNDPLAFLHAQKAWRPSWGFNWMRWLKMFMQIIVGSTNWKYGYIKDPWHPLLFVIITIIGYLLWRFRKQLTVNKVRYGFAFLGLVLWLLAGDPLINVVMILGGTYLMWLLRTELRTIALVYGLCAIGMLLASGSTISLNRLAYGVVSLSIALGILLSHYPRWGYIVLSSLSIPLASFAVRFAQELWVA